MKSEKAKKRLQHAIKKAGSQKAFAEANNLSEAYISDIMNDRRGFSERILRMIGLEIDYVNVKPK